MGWKRRSEISDQESHGGWDLLPRETHCRVHSSNGWSSRAYALEAHYASRFEASQHLYRQQQQFESGWSGTFPPARLADLRSVQSRGNAFVHESRGPPRQRLRLEIRCLVSWLHRIRDVLAEEPLPPRRQRKPFSVRPIPTDYERTVPAFKWEVFSWAARHCDGDAKIRPWPTLWHQLGLPAVHDVQGVSWQQAADRHLLDHGRYHWKTKFARLRGKLLQRAQTQTNFEDLLCPPTPLWRGLDHSDQLLFRHVLLVDEYEQGKSKRISCP